MTACALTGRCYTSRVPKWTKVDLRRLELAANAVWIWATPPKISDTLRATRARLLRGELGLRAIIHHFRQGSSPDSREGRAAARLAGRLEIEGMPADFVPPWAGAPTAPPAPAKQEEPQPKLELDPTRWSATEASQVAGSLRHLVHEARECVARLGDSQAFGTSNLLWGDVDGRVDWAAWLAGTAVALSPSLTPEKWARATAGDPSGWPPAARAFVRGVWVVALAAVRKGALELPVLLDCRRLPHSAGALDADFVDPLAAALRELPRGIVVLVEANSWVTERCLP